jgi:hypothetical protein
VASGGITLTFNNNQVLARTFMGRLIKEKDLDETLTIAARIRDVMNADILAVQEVEHVTIQQKLPWRDVQTRGANRRQRLTFHRCWTAL